MFSGSRLGVPCSLGPRSHRPSAAAGLTLKIPSSIASEHRAERQEPIRRTVLRLSPWRCLSRSSALTCARLSSLRPMPFRLGARCKR